MKHVIPGALAAAFLVVALAFSLESHSTVPSTVSFQGFASDSASGQPLDGSFDVTFNLYNVDTGGTPLWSETWNGGNQVPISEGIFDVELGALNPFGAGLFSEPLFLGIVLGADSEMTPRQPLLSVPYAIIADGVSDGAITASMLGADAVETNNIKDNSVTASKIDSTGLDSDTVDGIDGANIITATAGGTIANADLQVAGTGKFVANGQGVQFSDGSVQVTAAISAAGLTPVIPVTCDPSGATTPLQDVIDGLGPGGFITLEIDGVCKENVRIKRSFLEIRGKTDSSTDGIECEGNGPAVDVSDPVIAWLADLNLTCENGTAALARRNGLLGMYGVSDKVTITDSYIGALAQYGGNLQMFGVESSGNEESTLYVLDGASAFLSDIVFQESIDPNVYFAGVIEIGRNGSARITGNDTVITNSYFDGGEGNPIGWAVEVFHDSSVRIQDADGSGGVPTITGSVICAATSHMSLRNIDVTGEVSWHSCTGDMRNSSLQGNGSFDASITTSGSTGLRNNTLDVSRININDSGVLEIDSSNTFTGTDPDISINGGSAHIDADLTFASLFANGPGRITINGTLTDDADASDDFQINQMNFDFGGTLNGNMFVGKHSHFNLWDGAVVEGRLDVNDNTVGTVEGSASVEDCISVNSGSLLRVNDDFAFGTNDVDHDPCWTDGPSLTVSDRSSIQIGSWGTGATINGTVDVFGNSSAQFTSNSVVMGDVNANNNSSLNISGTEIHGDLSAHHSSVVDLFDGALVRHDTGTGFGGRAAAYDDSALSVSSDSVVEDCLEAARGSIVRLQDDAQHGFDANHDGCWSGGPSARAETSSILQLGNSADIQGNVDASNLSLVEMFDDSSVTGELNIDRRSGLAMWPGSSISSNVYAGYNSDISMDEATIGGDVSLARGSLTIGSSLDTISGGIFLDGALLQIFNGDTFNYSGGTLNVNNGGQVLVDGSATLNLGNQMFLSQHSRLVTRNNATVARASSTDDLIYAQFLSSIELGDDTVLTGIIGIDDTSQLSAANGVTFNGDLGIQQAPSRVSFVGSTAVSFGTHSIFCDTGGIVKGKTPSFTSGSIDGTCDDQTTP